MSNRRIALKITEDLMIMAAELTGAEPDQALVDAEIYIVMEPVSPLEFNLKVMTSDEVLEEYKKDETLHIMW